MVAVASWFIASYVSLWVLLLVVAIAVTLLYRHFGMMILGTLEGVERDGLHLGNEIPGISGVTAEGKGIRWEPATDRSTFLLFAAPHCAPCEEVLPWLGYLHSVARPEKRLDIVVVVRGPVENARIIDETFDASYPVVAEDGSGAFEAYGVRVTPFAFVVGDDNRVRAKGLCSDPVRLRSLFAAAGMSDVVAQLDPAVDDLLSRDRRAEKTTRAATVSSATVVSPVTNGGKS
jgi:hypothetical protein